MPRRIIGRTGIMTTVPRNPVARSPLLRKGGAHQETKTNQRRNARQALEGQLEDWREELEYERNFAFQGLNHTGHVDEQCSLY